MAAISNILCAITDFLEEAQNLGFVKEFTLTECEEKYEETLPKADVLITKFFDKLGCKAVASEHNDSSSSEYAVVSEDSENNIIIDHSDGKDIVEMQVDTYSENCSSSDTEHSKVIEHKKKTEIKIRPKPYAKENKVKIQDGMKEVSSKTEDSCLESPIKRSLVQIQVDTNEMKRRISAFMSRKRKEVDEWNVQEFCGRSYVDEQDPAWEKLDSCARVDAVFVPRRGCKSHIKVSKVKNISGPQTQLQSGAKKIKQEPTEPTTQIDDSSLQTIEERLLNMETHLKLKSDSVLRSNIFQRLKDLEDRILLLESSSPEYIHHIPSTDYSSPKKKSSFEKEKIYSNYNTDELQKKIQSIKESLKMKSPHIKMELLC